LSKLLNKEWEGNKPFKVFELLSSFAVLLLFSSYPMNTNANRFLFSLAAD